MGLAGDRDSERKAIGLIFEEAIIEAIGSPSYTIICFHLKKEFGEDPYETLENDPKAFYKGLQRVLGAGADVVLTIINTYLEKRYHVDFPRGDFATIFKEGDESLKLKLFGAISRTVNKDLR